MDILIINGPNLNLLGVREPAVYGNTSFDDFMKRLRSLYPHIGFDFFQSNHEARSSTGCTPTVSTADMPG